MRFNVVSSEDLNIDINLLLNYLENSGSGWQVVRSDETDIVWAVLTKESKKYSLLVMTNKEYADYEDRLADLLLAIREHKYSVSQVVTDIENWGKSLKNQES